MDFHTSPLIPDIGGHFDPQKFASTVKLSLPPFHTHALITLDLKT